MILLIWSGCVERAVVPPLPVDTGVVDVVATWPFTDPGLSVDWFPISYPPPLLTCTVPREADFAEWSGGARMHLVVEPFAAGDPLTFSVTGAAPGDTVELYAGSLCAFDCPQPDGGCFQAAGAEKVGTFLANGAGEVVGQLVPPPALADQWTVIQAVAPDSPVRYVSQPVIDHTGPFPGLPGGHVEVREVGPATIRGLVAGYDGWGFAVAAGRRAQVTVDLGVLPKVKWLDNELLTTTEGVTTRVAEPQEDSTFADETSAASRWTLWMAGTPDP